MLKFLNIIYVRNVTDFILFVLFAQVTDRQQRQMAEVRIAELEAEKQKEQAKLEEQKLLQELRKMEAAGYNPSVSALDVIF
jgi:membrane protein insertase Oxa1/YidC/SpoIIIJ